MLDLLSKLHKQLELNGRAFYLEKYEYRTDLFYGLLSGYSRCCIEAFFKKRHVRIKKNTSSEHKLLWEKIKAERDHDHYLKQFKHILCDNCLAGFRSLNFKPIYYYCTACDWTQFLKQECNLCGQLGTEDMTFKPIAIGR